MIAVPQGGVAPQEPPVEVVDEMLGIMVRSILLKEAGTLIPAHSHDVPHPTLVCAGKARLWIDSVWSGDFEAGQLVPILAGQLHQWQSLEPMTRLACLFDAERALNVSVH